ncbi:MarR family transcriptional regulator [Pseudomonas stutzeri]|uniref:MarR family transcriptional regulator n=1 Tax=Stutzerimonas stutzeri KOS6 TaxID=1218352 RepID=A0A061JML1_STUST|nr:MarR family transcriptional regulator [Stutzerimonas stutzeri]EWC40977.1 MarR family transcriptional regulator [Stutzerimonas stutzeri KOS6]MBK3866952.1 MarR family transcriptional regulator [Stutzerimonas stutzeri]
MSEETVLDEINIAALAAFEMPLFQALRRLQQDAEVHAKRLARYGGLSPVQLMILQVLASEGQLTASDLSRRVSLTAATLSGQLDRLEERGLLQRQRDNQDRRRQWLLLSDSGRALLQQAPALLPPEFRARFAALPQWERHGLAAALLRAAELCGDME